MSKKIILTEQQHAVIVSQILKETLDKINNIESNGDVNEGLMDTIKYGLSKLGRYKAGGNIFGKGKVDQEAARKIQQIIDKQGNAVIKQLDDTIRQENPEFPNNKEPEQFLSTVMSIAAVYDSVIASTKKNPNEEGYLPVDAANGVINDLREYVKKFLDVDLAAVYSTVNEEEIEQLDEVEAGDVRQQLQAKRGDSGEDFASTRMDTLKSNRLPLTLAGVGSALGGLSWLVNTDWFRSLFEEVVQNPSVEYVKELVEKKSDVFASIKPRGYDTNNE